jgi:hypothetical protein
MTDDQIIDRLVHVERILKGCHTICGKRGNEIMVAYNDVVAIGNALFENMQEYRDQFNDPTG